MSKTTKAWLIVFLGLIIWTAFVYLGAAFLKAEINAFKWSEDLRFGILFMIFCYGFTSPLLFMLIKEQLKGGEQ